MKIPLKSSIEVPNAPPPKPATPGPVMESVGLKRGEVGWAVYLLRTQDGRVLKEERLTEEEVWLVAVEQFRLQAARRILSPEF
jgi:hypothetical protein